LAASLLAILSGCRNDDGMDQIVRDTDKLDLSYAAVAEQFTVRVNGSWTATPDVDWLTIEPASGNGDGRQYEYVSVTPAHNTGDKRTGVITITSGTRKVFVNITQEDGYFSLGTPSVAGTLKESVETAQVYLVIPYSKAGGTEVVSVEVTVSGAVSGISVAPLTDFVLPMGNNSISMPITGIPSDIGEVTFTINVSVDGVAFEPITLDANVISENVILSQYFDLMTWGGDNIKNASGVKSNRGDSATPYDSGEYIVTCTANTDGTNNMFGKALRERFVNDPANPRGVLGWDGWGIFERPGYIKLGTGSYLGWIATPPLDLSAQGGTADVFITFKYSMWHEDPAAAIPFKAENGGTASISMLSGSQARTWKEYTIKVAGAKTGTVIVWGDNSVKGQNNNVAGQRFLLDDIVVTTKGVEEITTPLTEPQNVQVTASTGNSLTFGWDAVPNASGYKVRLALASNPDFFMETETDAANFTFNSLLTATKYHFKVQAMYSLNNAMNSPWTAELEGQTAGAVPKITTPVLQILNKTHGKFVVGWDYVTGWDDPKDRKFKIELAESATGPAIRSYDSGTSIPTNMKYRYNRFVFAGLAPSTTYYCRVQLLTRTNNTEYDPSEVAVISVTTEAAPTLGSDVVLYKDFEDFWCGGDGSWGAFGVLLASANQSGFVAAEQFTYTPTFGTNTIGNMGDSFNTGSTSDEYRAVRWPGGWSGTRIYEVAGYIKFATGSNNGILNTPTLNLAGSSNLKLTMKTCRYTEPNATTGDMTVSPAIEDGHSFTLTVNGAGTIDEAAGATSIMLNNRTNVDGISTTDRLQWTSQEVNITGADATTYITISTENTTNLRRMWLDDLKIVKK
jgi:hypothetical protein